VGSDALKAFFPLRRCGPEDAMSHDPSGSLWNASQRRWLPGLCSQWNTRVAGAVDLARQARPMVSAMEKPLQVMIPTGTSHESSIHRSFTIPGAGIGVHAVHVIPANARLDLWGDEPALCPAFAVPGSIAVSWHG